MHLSLRYNQISDAGAEHLGRCLGNVTSLNTHLLTLNLAGNRITDVGARHIANVSCSNYISPIDDTVARDLMLLFYMFNELQITL